MAVAQERDRLLFGKWSYDEVEVRKDTATIAAQQVLANHGRAALQSASAGAPWADRSPAVYPTPSSPAPGLLRMANQ